MQPKTLKDVVGYEGLYWVTSCGDIYSRRSGKFLKINKNKATGFYRVTLCKNNKPKMQYVRQLVAQAFLPDFGKGKKVTHRDGDKTNNCVDNLEVVALKRVVNRCNQTGSKLYQTGSQATNTGVHK